MGYASVNEVKALLRITISTFDTEIQTAIDDYDKAVIDVKLSPYTTVPLASPPDAIKKISKYGAAGLWLKLHPITEHSTKEADNYLGLAKEWLESYIKANYHKGKMLEE